eukprot:4330874-Pleurochrysis_carterae.AAC.1
MHQLACKTRASWPKSAGALLSKGWALEAATRESHQMRNLSQCTSAASVGCAFADFPQTRYMNRDGADTHKCGIACSTC